ncbi:Lrp/AsnC family transcriptional regulator [Flavobacteriaceae bacterium MHTCC 0001]
MVKDNFDWKIIKLLQENARLSYAQIGREIGLSPSATAERVQRLEDAEVLTRYISIINHKKVGYSLYAYITLSFKEYTDYQKFLGEVHTFPEIVDCSRITGNDCLIMKVVLIDNTHLENVVNRLAIHGSPSTSVVLSDIVTYGALKPLESIPKSL